MTRQIFVNLPIQNMERSQKFFRALGFDFNPQFTDEKGACCVISDNIFVMLLVEPFFKTFITKEICDGTKYAEVIVSLTCETREDVDAIVKKAVKAGGKTYNEPKDHGFMYYRVFHDLDGHHWEVFFMAPNHA